MLPPAEPRELLLLQVQQALQFVRPPDPVRRGVLVLEAAAAELTATVDADPDWAAVCADFAARFRADPLDDDAFLSFQARCGHWDGIAQSAYFAILADCTHVSEIGRTARYRGLVNEQEDQATIAAELHRLIRSDRGRSGRQARGSVEAKSNAATSARLDLQPTGRSAVCDRLAGSARTSLLAPIPFIVCHTDSLARRCHAHSNSLLAQICSETAPLHICTPIRFSRSCEPRP